MMKQVKTTKEVTRPVEVDGMDSELRVKFDQNERNGTYKISAFLTTKQVSEQSEQVREYTLKQLNTMLKEAIAECMAWRKDWLSANVGGDPAQIDAFKEQAGEAKDKEE